MQISFLPAPQIPALYFRHRQKPPCNKNKASQHGLGCMLSQTACDCILAMQPGYLHEQLPKEAPQQGEAWETIMDDVNKCIVPGTMLFASLIPPHAQPLLCVTLRWACAAECIVISCVLLHSQSVMCLTLSSCTPRSLCKPVPHCPSLPSLLLSAHVLAPRTKVAAGSQMHVFIAFVVTPVLTACRADALAELQLLCLLPLQLQLSSYAWGDVVCWICHPEFFLDWQPCCHRAGNCE